MCRTGVQCVIISSSPPARKNSLYYSTNPPRWQRTTESTSGFSCSSAVRTCKMCPADSMGIITLPHGGPGEGRCGGFGKVVFLRSNTLTKMLPWDLLDIRRMLVVPESFFTTCPSRERPLWPRYCSAQVEQPPMLSASAPLLHLPPWPARSGGSGITALR